MAQDLRFWLLLLPIISILNRMQINRDDTYVNRLKHKELNFKNYCNINQSLK